MSGRPTRILMMLAFVVSVTAQGAEITSLNHLRDRIAASKPVDLVKVDKSARKMYLMKGDEVLRDYQISLGANPKGHKFREGDKRTPEGHYALDFINENSRFYRSIRINYPNESDIQRASLFGFEPGGQIMIHGQKNNESEDDLKQRPEDWTDGCIAIGNEEMDEFLRLVKVGTPIHIQW